MWKQGGAVWFSFLHLSQDQTEFLFKTNWKPCEKVFKGKRQKYILHISAIYQEKIVNLQVGEKLAYRRIVCDRPFP